MSSEITKIKNKISALQKKYDDAMDKNKHLILDLKKAKIDVQEKALKYERGIFQMTKKLAVFKSELNGLKHKVSFSHSEYENIRKKEKDLRTELKLKSRDIEELSSDPL